MEVKVIVGEPVEYEGDQCGCECGTWLDHWRRRAPSRKVGLCKEAGCIEFATHGALVQKADSDDEEWYVVPLCNRHNGMKGEQITLFGNLQLLASAAVRKTCGKE